MSKKIIISIMMIILIGLGGFVTASLLEVQAPIYKGWNLLFGFANPNQLSGKLEESSIKAVYAFIPTIQEYAMVYPDVDHDKVGLIDDDELLNTAFWVYSSDETGEELNGIMNADEYNLEEEITLIGDRNIYKGWNFVGITPEMVGKHLNEIKGNCEIEKAFGWEYDHQKWQLLEDYSKFNKESLLTGIVVKVVSNCNLGTLEEEISPPPEIPN